MAISGDHIWKTHETTLATYLKFFLKEEHVTHVPDRMRPKRPESVQPVPSRNITLHFHTKSLRFASELPSPPKSNKLLPKPSHATLRNSTQSQNLIYPNFIIIAEYTSTQSSNMVCGVTASECSLSGRVFRGADSGPSSLQKPVCDDDGSH